MTSTKDSRIAKVSGLAVTLGAAWVAHQAIDVAWTKMFGHKAPRAENEADSRIGEVVLAATITGAVVALTRVLATRGVAKFLS